MGREKYYNPVIRSEPIELGFMTNQTDACSGAETIHWPMLHMGTGSLVARQLEYGAPMKRRNDTTIETNRR